MLVLLAILCSMTIVAGIEPCDQPLGPGTAAPQDPFWMQTIKHQGIAAYNPKPHEYNVFRNVKVGSLKLIVLKRDDLRRTQDFGAKGDGITDDTAAIKSVISPVLSLPV